jgi:hypothetical protein
VALQTEFHELVALALGVADREIGFGLTVGCADDVGGLVDTTLELAWYLVRIFFLLSRGACSEPTFVSTFTGIRIDGVDFGVVAGLSVSAVRAIRLGKISTAHFKSTCSQAYTIQSVKEGIEKIGGRNLLRFIELVINLIESDRLWVDQGVSVHGVSCLIVTTSE